MKTLIFDSEIDGHHLEYMHHLYERASRDSQEYIFLTNAKFEQVKNKFFWAKASNIKIEYLSSEEQTKCDNPRLLKSAWDKSRILKKYVKYRNIDSVWLITLMKLMPFLPLLLPPKVLISGILYRVFL